MEQEFDGGGLSIESRTWWTLNLANNNKRHVLRLFIKLCHRRLLRQLLTWSRTISGTHTHTHTLTLHDTHSRAHSVSLSHSHAPTSEWQWARKRLDFPPAMCARELKRGGVGSSIVIAVTKQLVLKLVVSNSSITSTVCLLLNSVWGWGELEGPVTFGRTTVCQLPRKNTWWQLVDDILSLCKRTVTCSWWGLLSFNVQWP